MQLTQDTQTRSPSSAPVTAVYESEDGAKAVLTFRNRTIYGWVELSEEKGDYRLETVDNTGDEFNVVWAQLSNKVWQEDEPEPMEELGKEEDAEEDRSEELLALGDSDQDTVVEYSVTVYYTQEFLESTSDPDIYRWFVGPESLF